MRRPTRRKIIIVGVLLITYSAVTYGLPYLLLDAPCSHGLMQLRRSRSAFLASIRNRSMSNIAKDHLSSAAKAQVAPYLATLQTRRHARSCSKLSLLPIALVAARRGSRIVSTAKYHHCLVSSKIHHPTRIAFFAQQQEREVSVLLATAQSRTVIYSACRLRQGRLRIGMMVHRRGGVTL